LSSQLLADFLFRLTFGIAAAMTGISSKDVSSGFFRVHLWVLLGLQTLAALCTASSQQLPHSEGSVPAFSFVSSNVALHAPFLLAIAAAVASYIGSVLWLYESQRLGKFVIHVVANCAIAALIIPILHSPTQGFLLRISDCIVGGRVLGITVTSMLLGHWYLNSPTMKLDPLKSLLMWLAVFVVVRMVFCAVSVSFELTDPDMPPRPANVWFLYVVFRWVFGFCGVLVLTALARLTLRIPNTQSATGILYAAVVLAIIGELTSRLLSVPTAFPI
jgi:hypothetical protein